MPPPEPALNRAMSPRFRLWHLVAMFAGAHLVLALGSLATSYTLGMSRFDAAEFLHSTAIEYVAAGASNVLFQPALALFRVLDSGSHQPFVQWFALGCNSLLWGLAAAFVFRHLARRLNVRHHDHRDRRRST